MTHKKASKEAVLASASTGDETPGYNFAEGRVTATFAIALTDC